MSSVTKEIRKQKWELQKKIVKRDAEKYGEKLTYEEIRQRAKDVKLTDKQRRRIEKRVVAKHKRRVRMGAVLAAIGIGVGAGFGVKKLEEGKRRPVPTTEERTDSVSEPETAVNIEREGNKFRTELKTTTYNDVLSKIVEEYNSEYGEHITANNIAYVKSNPQYLAIDENGNYVSDYKENRKYPEYVKKGISVNPGEADIGANYVFVDKTSERIIGAMGKVNGKIQDIETTAVKTGDGKEYVGEYYSVENGEKVTLKEVSITKGMSDKEKEGMYEAVELYNENRTQSVNSEKEQESER